MLPHRPCCVLCCACVCVCAYRCIIREIMGLNSTTGATAVACLDRRYCCTGNFSGGYSTACTWCTAHDGRYCTRFKLFRSSTCHIIMYTVCWFSRRGLTGQLTQPADLLFWLRCWVLRTMINVLVLTTPTEQERSCDTHVHSTTLPCVRQSQWCNPCVSKLPLSIWQNAQQQWQQQPPQQQPQPGVCRLQFCHNRQVPGKNRLQV